MDTTLNQLADALQSASGRSVLQGKVKGFEIGENDRNAGRLLEAMLAAGLINDEATIRQAWETLATLMWWLVYWQTALQGEPDPLVAELSALRERVELAEEKAGRLYNALECVHDYAFHPTSPRVNAGEMDAKTRLGHAGVQARAALEEVDALDDSAWRKLKALRGAALEMLQRGTVELRKLDGSMHSAVIYAKPSDLENFLAQFEEGEVNAVETDWSKE